MQLKISKSIDSNLVNTSIDSVVGNSTRFWREMGLSVLLETVSRSKISGGIDPLEILVGSSKVFGNKGHAVITGCFRVVEF